MGQDEFVRFSGTARGSLGDHSVHSRSAGDAEPGPEPKDEFVTNDDKQQQQYGRSGNQACNKTCRKRQRR